MPEHWGRGGLPADRIAHALRLLGREERLTDVVIARRVGCGRETVRKLRRGVHRSQTGADRRGNRPVRVRLALELLATAPSVRRVARLLGMRYAAVSALARGDYITQRAGGETCGARGNVATPRPILDE